MMNVMKNVNVYLNGKVVELDPKQTYNIRVELEDGSPVWVSQKMLNYPEPDLPYVPEVVIHDAYELRKALDVFNANSTGNFFGENGVLKMSEFTRRWFDSSAENRMKFFKIVGSD